MKNVYDVLMERGYIEQCTHEEEIKRMLANEKVTFYIGFDPTADSLHIGHFIQIMVMAHMQHYGHRPIAVIGGGTTMIGDPSGRSDMRQVMTQERIAENAEKFKKIFEKFLTFEDDKALMVNNADWLLNLNYINFLRDVGAHFSVNRMLTAECYKQRLERGLTFLEFNYMLMQGYDFLELFKRHGCRLQMGGDDQWSNMLAGADLIRRKEREDAFACTFKLLMTHEGKKMGKTERGALWLDPELCSPYEFYQYWRNVSDHDVSKSLSMLTFLPMEEVRRLSALEGADINEAKKVLAFECTKIVHGEDEAQKAQEASAALFSGGSAMDEVPTYAISRDELEADSRLTTLLNTSGLCTSKSEARKMVIQGAVAIGDEKVTDIDTLISYEQIGSDGLLLRRGKKNYVRLIMKI